MNVALCRESEHFQQMSEASHVQKYSLQGFEKHKVSLENCH